MASTKDDRLIDDLTPYFKRRHDPTIDMIVTTNVSDPPTDAELDSAFGQPADLPDGFVGVVNDNNAGINIWIVRVIGGFWWYHPKLTKAV